MFVVDGFFVCWIIGEVMEKQERQGIFDQKNADNQMTLSMTFASRESEQY